MAIQSGRRELWPELWRQMQGLAWQYIHKWSWAKEKAGMEREDLLQVSKLALLMAADSYDPDRGARFSTWFVTAMQREFTLAAGLRTEKQSADPLRTAGSLDAPVSSEVLEDLCLADIIPDPAAEEMIEGAALRLAVWDIMEELPKDQRAALRKRYWAELPLDKADHKAHDAGLRALRHPSRSRRLRDFAQCG